MFLHSGASLHGHEYSLKTSSSLPLQPGKGKSLLRTALRPLSIPCGSTEADYLVTSSRPESYSSRRASGGETHDRPSLLRRQRAASNSLTKKDAAVRSQQPCMDQIHSPSASEDDEFIAGSDFTDGTADTSNRRKKRRRLPRKSTRYAVAQPAPQIRTKQRHLLQLRPRLLLQLQEIGDRRAIPAFDLIPSRLLVGTLILPKLVKRFPRIFHANADLGQNDVLLVRSEDYGPTPTRLSTLLSNDGRGAHHEKDVCAIISALPKGCDNLAEIIMENGSSWVASAMANGSYEFTGADEDGETTTARWVRRRSNVSTRNSLASTEPLQDSAHDPRWTFSIIDPAARRHPIMGSLTPGTLEVYEGYTTLSTSSGRFPPSRFSGADANGHHSPSAGFAPEPRRTLQVRQEQKVLMIATASWIRLHQQGWPDSCNPKLSKAIPLHRLSVGGTPRSKIRRQTFPLCDEDSYATSRPNSPDSIRGSTLSKHQRQARVAARATYTGRAFMKGRSQRLQELAIVDGQEAPLPGCQGEKLAIREEAEKTTCLCRMRQWTNKLFHRRKEVPS